MLSKFQTEAAILEEIEQIREIRKKQMRSIRRITNGWDHIDVRDGRTRQLILNAYNSRNPLAMLNFEDEAFVNGTLELDFLGDYRVPRPMDERRKCECNPGKCTNMLKCPPVEKGWQSHKIQMIDTLAEQKTEKSEDNLESSDLETDRKGPGMTGTEARAISKELKPILKKVTAMNEDEEDAEENVGENGGFKEKRMKSPVEIEMIDMSKPFGTPEAQKYVDIVAKSCQSIAVVDELVEEGALNGKLKPKKTRPLLLNPPATKKDTKREDETFSEVRMLDFFDNLRQLSALTDAVNAKVNFATPSGESSGGDQSEEEKAKTIDDHPFSIIASIESFVKRLHKKDGRILQMKDIESMSSDEILFIGCLRNKSALKPDEVSVVNKLALEFMEIRIKELEKEELPTDHARRLFYRFMVHKYDPLLGPIIQYLAMSGKRKIRDVEWNFFSVVAGTKE